MKSIELTKGFVAKVDSADFEWLTSYSWCVSNKKSHGRDIWYAVTSIRHGRKHRQVGMHRMIMDCPPGLVVHHKDEDTLNNTRANLEIVTHMQNMHAAPNWRRKKDSLPDF